MPNPLNPRDPRRLSHSDFDALRKESQELVAASEKRLGEAREEIASLSKQITTLRKESDQRVGATEEQLRITSQEREGLSQEVELLRKQLEKQAGVATKLEAAEEARKSLTEQISTLKKESEERTKAAEQDTKALSEQMATLSKQSEQRVSVAERRVQQTEQEKKALAEKAAALQKQVDEYAKAAEQQANERKRLKVLEKSLSEATTKIEGMTGAEETRSRKAVEEMQRQLQTAQQDRDSLAGRVNALIEENRRLAESVEPITQDLAKFREIARTTRTETEATQQALAAATKARTEAEKRLETTEAQRQRLQSQVAGYELQLKREGKTPFLSADKVAEMVAGLTDQLRGSLGGLNPRDGEIKLKVAFGGAGEQAGFILPTIESGADITDKLHELTIRFDRGTFTPPEPGPQR